MKPTDVLMFDNLLENMTDGIFIIGYDGHIRMDNSVASEVLDIGSESLSGKTIVDLISENSKNDAFFECITLAVHKREKISEIVTFYRQDGSERQLRLVVSPLRDREDDIAAIVMFSDVTEITDLGEQNDHLNRKLVEFIQGFVKVMVDAIDKRSHFNATHTRKMVGYATRYLAYLEEQGKPISTERRDPFLASIWLHDVGKLVIPYRILEKPNRLADKEKDIIHRAEVSILIERLNIAALNSDEMLSGSDSASTDSGNLVSDLVNKGGWVNLEDTIRNLSITDEKRRQLDESRARIRKLEEAIEFVKQVNNRGFIDAGTRKRIQEIAMIECHTFDGGTEYLLDNYDIEALTVERGNLTANERKIVMSHVTETQKMLEEMNFEGEFANVPDWAGHHHEYLDGTGYPDGLSGDEISWESRLITIIDIYDALTADDRPYKPPMSAEKAFEILRSMKEEGKLDGEILEDFIKSGAWQRD